jgi:signal transduction histidine kinase
MEELHPDFAVPKTPWYHSVFFRITIIVAFVLVLEGYFVYRLDPQIGASEFFVIRAMRTHPMLLIGFAVSDFIFAVILIWFYIGVSLSNLTRAMREVSRGNFKIEIPETRNDEIGKLEHFFNAMIKKMYEVRTRQAAISQLKSEFVATAAHQLRTPLSGLRWGLQTALGSRAGMTPETSGLLQKSYDYTDKVIRILNDLLNAASIEEGRFGYHFAETDVLGIIDKVLRDVDLQAKSHNVGITFDRPQRHTLPLVADDHRLAIALTNIVSNAVIYSRPGGAVRVGLSQDNDFLKIKIRDEGIGIPPDSAEKLFNRFYRAPNALAHQTDGSGLGLFISRNIMRAHGGDVWFDSQIGRGSTFYLSIPLRKELLPEAKPTLEEFVGGL